MRTVRIALAVTILAGLVTFFAWAAIDLPGTQPADGNFPPFPNFQNDFDAPSNCSSCHGSYRDAGDAPYEPYDTWAGSLMAQATRDPLFWAALDIANQDDALLGDAGVGDFCIRCHSPLAWYEGRSDCSTAWGEEFDGSCFLGSIDTDGQNNDFEGIHCHYCHRQYDGSSPAPGAGQYTDPLAPYAQNGEVYLTTEDARMYGPYSDAEPPGRHDFFGEQMFDDSAYCGQCHNVTHPAFNRLDESTGADLGYRMPVERTYDEWTQSEYGRVASPDFTSCQRCHMPPADTDRDGTTDDVRATDKNTKPIRGENTAHEGPVWTHFFRGGGAWMHEVLKAEYGAALNRTAEFDEAILQSRELLEEETATLQITAPSTTPAGAPLSATVRVTNLGGHKLPTGYPEGRRAWVNVRGGEDLDFDGELDQGEVTYESGAYDASTGVLAHDAEEKIYEIQVGIWNHNGTGQCDLVDQGSGQKMFHFVLNNCIKLDNRIPPKGFTPSVETEPVGYVYPPDAAIPGSLAHWDDSVYQVPVPPGAAGDFLIEAKLYYQTTSKEYIDFLVAQNQSTCDPFDAGCNPTQANSGQNRSEKMEAMWIANGRAAPIELAGSLATIAVTGTSAGPGQAANPIVPADQLFVSGYDGPTGDVTIDWAPACDATNHNVYWGDLSQVGLYNYSGVQCSVGTSGTTVFNPGPGNAIYFLVVGNNGSVEGSYGHDALGAERPEDPDTPACPYAQALTAVCE